jgi:hypothetical protein
VVAPQIQHGPDVAVDMLTEGVVEAGDAKGDEEAERSWRARAKVEEAEGGRGILAVLLRALDALLQCRLMLRRGVGGRGGKRRKGEDGRVDGSDGKQVSPIFSSNY